MPGHGGRSTCHEPADPSWPGHTYGWQSASSHACPLPTGPCQERPACGCAPGLCGRQLGFAGRAELAVRRVRLVNEDEHVRGVIPGHPGDPLVTGLVIALALLQPTWFSQTFLDLGLRPTHFCQYQTEDVHWWTVETLGNINHAHALFVKAKHVFPTGP